jgi:hypothetical protein
VTFGGIGLIGITREPATKLWLTLGVIGAIIVVRLVLGLIARGTGRRHAREALAEKYGLDLGALEPRAYWQLTDNWLEMTVRFVVPEHGIRNIRDQITRTVLREFDAAGIQVASISMEVTVMKPA